MSTGSERECLLWIMKRYSIIISDPGAKLRSPARIEIFWNDTTSHNNNSKNVLLFVYFCDLPYNTVVTFIKGTTQVCLALEALSKKTVKRTLPC